MSKVDTISALVFYITLLRKTMASEEVNTNQTSHSVAAKKQQTPEFRRNLIGDLADLLGILDALPEMGDDDNGSTAQWEEMQKMLESLLQGQLDIKDTIEDAIQDGAGLGTDIKDSVEKELNDLNGQYNDIADQIGDMQQNILTAMSSFQNAMMGKFDAVIANQQLTMEKLDGITDQLTELSKEVNQLSGKVDWNNMVTMVGTHIQRIEHLFDCFSQISYVETSPSKSGNIARGTELVNYFRLREWAHAVMDFSNGIPLALDVLDQLIMGGYPLLPSLYKLQIQLLVDDVFPLGDYGNKYLVCEDYYLSLATIQVKGTMCIMAASEILRISDSYKNKTKDRIDKQRQFVEKAIKDAGLKESDPWESPEEGEYVELEFDTAWAYYDSFASSVLLEDLVEDLPDDEVETWAITNYVPFITENYSSLHKGGAQFKICVVKLLPNYQVDASSMKWIEYDSGDFFLKYIGEGMRDTSQHNNENFDDILIQRKLHEIPENAVMTGFRLRNISSKEGWMTGTPSAIDYTCGRVIKLDIRYCSYLPSEGKWQQPETWMEVPHEEEGDVLNENLYQKIDPSGSSYYEGSEHNLGTLRCSFTANVWLGARVSTDDILPIANAGFLIETETSKGDQPNDQHGYVQFKFRTGKNNKFTY